MKRTAIRIIGLWPWLFVALAAIGLGLFGFGQIADDTTLSEIGVGLMAPLLGLVGLLIGILLLAAVLNVLVLVGKTIIRRLR